MKHLILRKSVMVPARRHASVVKMMTVAAVIASLSAFVAGAHLGGRYLGRQLGRDFREAMQGSRPPVTMSEAVMSCPVDLDCHGLAAELLAACQGPCGKAAHHVPSGYIVLTSDAQRDLALDPACSPTHRVTSVFISGRPEIDQPKFEAPTSVWLCQDPDAVRLVWVRDGATQPSFTTLDEGDSINYIQAVDEGFCDPYRKYGADPCADLH